MRHETKEQKLRKWHKKLKIPTRTKMSAKEKARPNTSSRKCSWLSKLSYRETKCDFVMWRGEGKCCLIDSGSETHVTTNIKKDDKATKDQYFVNSCKLATMQPWMAQLESHFADAAINK